MIGAVGAPPIELGQHDRTTRFDFTGSALDLAELGEQRGIIGRGCSLDHLREHALIMRTRV